MKEKILAIVLMLVLAIATVSITLTPSVQANSISNLTIEPGVVSAIFKFNCGDADTIYIKYKVAGTITFNQSYTDPDDMNSADRVNLWGDNTLRWMLVRFLNESTTYYYEIWVDGGNDTSGTFTTLDRFTDQWADEFLDDYLWNSSGGVQIYQSVGVKQGFVCMQQTDGYAMHTHNNTIKVWSENRTQDGWGYGEYQDGNVIAQLNWTPQLTVPYRFRGICPQWDPETNKWLSVSHVYDVGDPYNTLYLRMSQCDNETGPWSYAPGSDSNGRLCSFCYDGTQEHSNTFFNDTMGANKWVECTNWHKSPEDRWPGCVIGLNNTVWLTFDFPRGTLDARNVYNGLTGQSLQTYGPYLRERNGIYICFLPIYDGSTYIKTYLCSSRNLWNYSFIDANTQIIPLGAPGSIDDGAIWLGLITTDGDKDIVMYDAQNGTHGQPLDSYIAQIDFRKFGLSYVKPTDSSGWLMTTSIPGKFRYNFTVNGDFSASAKFNISLMNATTGNVYYGFAFSDFNTITTNSTSIEPIWEGSKLESVPAGAFKINFSWDGSGSGELYSYTLDAGEDEQQAVIQFISIDGGLNGTTTYNSTPTFNWTVVSGASMYWLQIANNSDFAQVHMVVNLSDINVYNYPSNYAENVTRVSFTIPNALTVGDTYYCRVKAYVKGGN